MTRERHDGRRPDAAVQNDTSPFKAIVKLTKQNLQSSGLTLPVAAGMQVQAEIKQGERTVMEYLLSPVRRVAQGAGRER
jgi:hemolysin D